MSLSVTTANVWRENRQIERDLRTLTATGDHLIGINEGGGYTAEIRAAAAAGGYRVHMGREREQNPVLVRDDLLVIGASTFTTSSAVGISPARNATEVLTDIDGVRAALINTHANSHVQAGAAKPHRLPRVDQYIRGSRLLADRVKKLERAGWAVIVMGDLNWAWTPGPVQWAYSPRRVFGRLGYVSQFVDAATRLERPKGDRRAIEYVLYKEGRVTVEGQRFLAGEKSDHPFHQVDLTIQETP